MPSKPATINGSHASLIFNSFSEMIDNSEAIGPIANLTARLADQPRFFGASTYEEAHHLARTGLPREGIEALALSEKQLQETDRELVSAQFQTYYDVAGSDVDVSRFLSGEPENMVAYYMEVEPRVAPVVTLVISTAVHCGISVDAIRRHGRALMAMLEAIESTGLQTEIWADQFTKGSGGKTCRVAARLKAPGELFDAGMFMFAMTHPAFYRAIGIKNMYGIPKSWHGPLSMSASGGHGQPQNTPQRMEEFPDGAIYIPSITHNSEAGTCVTGTLRALGLLAD